MKETQARAEVLRLHHMGEQVLADLTKWIANNQRQPQRQTPQQLITIGTGSTATVVDDEDGANPNFFGCPHQHSTPPDIGSMLMEIEHQEEPNQTR